ncbi:MAG: hydrogen gas-evolving membrane-bound hydrogenase subunit E [Balneolaceae bacterium]|nr:hydrogen gas-evolving membrane-bound hydrogenase subunit E [Balneolaceae bacterium]
MQKGFKILLLLLFAGTMIFAASDLPFRGDPDNRMNAERSLNNTPVIGNYAIQNAYRDAHTPNIVTVILGDYRSVDTFGEQIVIYTAGLITLLVLRRTRRLRRKTAP